MFAEILKCNSILYWFHTAARKHFAQCSCQFSFFHLIQYKKKINTNRETMQYVALCKQFPKSIFFTQSFESQPLNYSSVARRMKIYWGFYWSVALIWNIYIYHYLFDLWKKKKKNNKTHFGNRLAHTHRIQPLWHLFDLLKYSILYSSIIEIVWHIVSSKIPFMLQYNLKYCFLQNIRK